MNSSSNWRRILEKLSTTRELDRQCQAFGAEVHSYQLRPALAPQELAWAEEALGAPFPDELRTFYLEVGDGGAGPGYGMYPSSELKGYRPGAAYPGLEALTQAARAAGWNPEDCLRLPEGALAGVAGIIHDGCGAEMCVILNGSQAGELVQVGDECYFAETGKTLSQQYEEWLDKILRHFRAVEGWMRAGATLQEIEDKLNAGSGEDWICCAGSTISSIANEPKPVELFGDPRQGSRIVHGAIQTPWYEEVLNEWQARNLGNGR